MQHVAKSETQPESNANALTDLMPDAHPMALRQIRSVVGILSTRKRSTSRSRSPVIHRNFIIKTTPKRSTKKCCTKRKHSRQRKKRRRRRRRKCTTTIANVSSTSLSTVVTSSSTVVTSGSGSTSGKALMLYYLNDWSECMLLKAKYWRIDWQKCIKNADDLFVFFFSFILKTIIRVGWVNG